MDSEPVGLLRGQEKGQPGLRLSESGGGLPQSQDSAKCPVALVHQDGLMWGGVGVLSPASCGNGQAEVGHLHLGWRVQLGSSRNQGEWVAHAVCIRVKSGHKEERSAGVGEGSACGEGQV